MLPTLLLSLASAASAASIYQRAALQQIPTWPLPTDCVPLSCKNATVVCSADKTEQVCQELLPTGDYHLDGLGRACSNETFSPTYPITNYCVDILAPYDKAQIPSDCVTTMCGNMDGSPMALWCLYFKVNGMVWRRLQMQCPP